MQSQFMNNLPVPAKQSNKQIDNIQEFSETRSKELSSGVKDSFLPNVADLPWQKMTKVASTIEDSSPSKEVYIKEMVETKNAEKIEGFVSLTMLTEDEKKENKSTVPKLHGIKEQSIEKEESIMAPLQISTKIYVGSLTIVGLYIMYRAVKKTM